MLLKRRIDIRTLILFFMSWGALMSMLLLSTEQVLTWWSVLWVGIGAQLVFHIALINHNQRHHPIFVSEGLNRLLNRLISIGLGAPSGRLHAIHHYNHHRHYQDHRDLSHWQLHAKGTGVKRILSYVISGGKKISADRKHLVVPPKLQREIVQERVVLLLFSVVALLLSPAAFLVLILPSWFLGLMFLFVANLFNHDLCETDTEHLHSRNFTGFVENWFFLNNGFHSIHHDHPGQHWSDLPEMHNQKYAGKLTPDLNQKSFYGYALKYVLNSYGEKA